ncbi:DUF6660 family protein [Emticicia sp. TH156]|uniref:DUF6660 family protein n=1 Tax=Emticicia sp. TH156 TaxID=2067454 RepID=UPI000CC2DC5A|nr:hypothetical protein C0V77_06470 [Emticicia sp. TH156]
MKIFSVILALYVLTLSFLPCGDIEDCTETGIDKILFSQTDHSSHQEDAEYCSPFCICACCGTNISFNFYIPFLETENPIFFYEQNSKIAYRNDFSFSNFYANIWQPPRLV